MCIKQKKTGKLVCDILKQLYHYFGGFLCSTSFYSISTVEKTNSCRMVSVTFMKVKKQKEMSARDVHTYSQFIKCTFLSNDSHQINQTFMKVTQCL